NPIPRFHLQPHQANSNTIDIQIPTVSNLSMPTRLRRVEQVERNRELVLSAAKRVFVDRGYVGATLEAIAEEAGFSKGVVYSQFGSKPDLFFALLEERIEWRAAHQRQVVSGRSGLDAFQALLRAGDEDSASDPGWRFVLAEFR